jgi:hypothetical protein
LDEDFTITPRDLLELEQTSRTATGATEKAGTVSAKGPLLDTFLAGYGYKAADFYKIRFLAKDAYRTLLRDEYLTDYDVVMAVSSGKEPLAEDQRPMRLLIPEAESNMWIYGVIRIEFEFYEENRSNNAAEQSEVSSTKQEWYSDDGLMCGYMNKRLTAERRLTITVVDRNGANHDLEMGISALHLENITYFDNNIVAVEAYVNPSLREYTVFDLNTDQKTITYYGYGFTYDGDDIYYVQAPQHFGGVTGKTRLVKNDKVLMETAEYEVIYGEFTVEEGIVLMTIRDERTEDLARQQIFNSSDSRGKPDTPLYYDIVVAERGK